MLEHRRARRRKRVMKKDNWGSFYECAEMKKEENSLRVQIKHTNKIKELKTKFESGIENL